MGWAVLTIAFEEGVGVGGETLHVVVICEGHFLLCGGDITSLFTSLENKHPPPIPHTITLPRKVELPLYLTTFHPNRRLRPPLLTPIPTLIGCRDAEFAVFLSVGFTPV